MKSSIRNICIGIIVVIVLSFVVMRGDQLVELIYAMKRGFGVALCLAVVSQLGKYVSQGFAYHFAFASVGETMHVRHTLPLVFGTFFMNTVAPSLNMAGATLVIDDARRRGIRPGKATSAALLMQMTIESGFMIIMIVGFALLFIAGKLSAVWFLLGVVVVCMVLGMAVIMVVGRTHPSVLVKVLTPIERIVNKVLVKFKKESLKPWVHNMVQSFGEAAGIIARKPRVAAKAFGSSIMASIFELLTFCLVGVAFGITDIDALICGYVMATLFAMISITPQGVGVVETAVVVCMGAFGINTAAAMAAVLVYRGIVFWMPFLIGAVLIQRTKLFQAKE